MKRENVKKREVKTYELLPVLSYESGFGRASLARLLL